MKHRAQLVAVALITTFEAIGFGAGPELEKVRNDYAIHFFDAVPHLRLAKYLVDHGDPLTAFFISETARRENFTAEEFERAFRVVFRDDHFDNSPAAEGRIQAELAEAPRDVQKMMALADVCLSRSDWAKAEAQLRKVMALAPDSFEPIPVLAEVLRRAKKKDEATKLEDDWMREHPDSLEAWHERVSAAIEADSAGAEESCKKGLEKYPQDGMLHFDLARLLQKKKDLPGAAAEFERAAKLDPRSAFIQGWTGRFFLKAMNDGGRALPYYLAAYFLDPDFYDTEYAEGRIRTIAYERAQVRYAADRASGVADLDLMNNADPVIAGLAMADAEKTWNEKTRDRFVDLLSRDDSNLRYQAAGVLGQHATPAFDERLRALLTSSDLRVRAAAAYIAGARWKTAVVPMLTPWLTAPADLIRYDAVSVVIEDGGEPGKALLRKLRKSGTVKDPRMRAILESMDRAKAPE